MKSPVISGAFSRAFLAASLVVAGFVVDSNARVALARSGQACWLMSPLRDAFIKQPGAKLTELTDNQRAFAAAIFVLNPNTAPGLPYGDKAVLGQIAGTPGGEILFIDGDQACEPMSIPQDLIEMLEHIGAGDVTHPSNSGSPM